MCLDVIPEPREIDVRPGFFAFEPVASRDRLTLGAPDAVALQPARLLAARLGARVVSGPAAENSLIRLRLVASIDLGADLRPEQRIEAYRLTVDPGRVELAALTPEGLLRGAATLLQISRFEARRLRIPCAMLLDWPAFRYRCAADWLVNVECNRWALDWADGRKAFLERVKRKLDFCFLHKINLVWFDGFGWDTERFRGYAPLMRTCTRYARQRGIKLEFGGYGGGYGTAYQAGEIYRCGYFGEVFMNRRPYPGGKPYACRGWSHKNSRLYGTCLSNTKLRQAKLAEMKRFVAEVNPGFMYIHDIDAGLWTQGEETWKQRCPVCRKRWPNDALDAPDGQAGACADWFRQVRRELSALPAAGDYDPARDLVLAFVSPLYASYSEIRPANVWEREKHYFACLSRLIGPETGIEFGLRELFYDPRGRKKIPDLRACLDKVGNGHALLVISFGGGDNYISDDLTHVSGAMAHFFDGAESVCISNHGMHQAPIQMLNAAFLWSGSAGGYRESPPDQATAEACFHRMGAAAHRPPELFARGGYIEGLCVRLWGRRAGPLMFRALTSRHNGQPPVAQVWWSMTQTLGTLRQGDETLPVANLFPDRKQASLKALRLARRAAAVSDHEDIGWFVCCLEIGAQFADAMHTLFRIKAGDATARKRLRTVAEGIKADVRTHAPGPFVDKLGGDPGCWLETLAEIERQAERFAQRPADGAVFSDFICHWQVSEPSKPRGEAAAKALPPPPDAVSFAKRVFSGAFCDVQDGWPDGDAAGSVQYFAADFQLLARKTASLCLGYDGPVTVWIDGEPIFSDPDGCNPAKVDAAVIPLCFARGKHVMQIGLGANGGKACGIYARLRFANP